MCAVVRRPLVRQGSFICLIYSRFICLSRINPKYAFCRMTKLVDAPILPANNDFSREIRRFQVTDLNQRPIGSTIHTSPSFRRIDPAIYEIRLACRLDERWEESGPHRDVVDRQDRIQVRRIPYGREQAVKPFAVDLIR